MSKVDIQAVSNMQKAFCEVLDLDPNWVKKLTITMESGSLPTVDVEFFIVDATALADTAKEYAQTLATLVASE